MKMVKNTLMMILVVGSFSFSGCFSTQNIVGVEDQRPPQMNNTPFTNFVPANTPK